MRPAARLLLPLLALLPVPSADAAVVDLVTPAGLAAVQGSWRVHDAAIVPAEFRAPGADGQPGARAAATFDIEPRAGAAGFDDSTWEAAPPAALALRRGGGKLSFVWYRLRFALPDELDGEAVGGATLSFEVLVDDAAEIWVNGELRRCPGQRGGSMVGGWNAANRVVLTRDARAGQEYEVAVFGVNGPLSGSPTNYVWMRSARLEIAPTPAGEGGPRVASPACEVNVEIERRDPRLDAIVSRNPKALVIADGFSFTEGPLWVPEEPGEPAHLLFSEPNANRIWKWLPTSAGGELALFRERSGYDGGDIARYRQPGSNGLALDPQGRLTIDEHGRRRVSRVESDGSVTVLAERYEGRRLNSPNDLVYRSDGSLYFTDPFFGLPQFDQDPAKEIAFQGVYRVAPARPGKVELLTKELAGPNGIAFSPDEQWLYVGDWDDRHKAVSRFPVLANGRLGRGELFVDLTAQPGEDAIDGVKVDALGNVYISGPGGLWIVAADRTVLGVVRLARHPHNMAWGEDGRTLFLTARDEVLRLPLLVQGFAPQLKPRSAQGIQALNPKTEAQAR